MISLCILTKNEEKNLAKCIESVKSIVDEIIVVDTGSQDNTKEIALEFKAKIYDFSWNNDFSEVRNFAYQQATKDWILNLDADETIGVQDLESLKELTKSDQHLGYSFIQRNYTSALGESSWISSTEDTYQESKIASGFVPRRIVRLFKNDPRIISQGVIHDSVISSIEKIGTIGETSIPIHHLGYVERNKEKARRYIESEKMHLKNDFFQEYQIAVQLHAIGEYKEALEHLVKSISINPNFYLSWLELAIISIKKGKISEARPLLVQSLRLQEHESAWNHLAIIEVYEKNLEQAVLYFQRAITINPKNADYYFNLGQTYKQLQQMEEAQEAFDQAIFLNPAYKEKI